MNNSRRLLRINIGFLINQPVGYPNEIYFDFEALPIGEGMVFIHPRGVIRLARTQNGLRSLIDFSASLQVECGRCLETFQLPLSTHFEEIFTFQNRPLSEDEQVIPEDGNIDFEPLIRDYLLLEVPINPICRPDCRGLCSICGENLNQKNCVHNQVANEEVLTALGVKINQSLNEDDCKQRA